MGEWRALGGVVADLMKKLKPEEEKPKLEACDDLKNSIGLNDE